MDIAALLNSLDFVRCPKCYCVTWKNVGNETRCWMCNDIHHSEKYGVAELVRDSLYGAIHIYVHDDPNSAEDYFPISSTGSLLYSKRMLFERSIDITLNSNRIPCPQCKRLNTWVSGRGYSYCEFCSKRDDFRGYADFLFKESGYSIECIIQHYRESEPIYRDRLFFTEKEENIWSLVEDDTKDPGYN